MTENKRFTTDNGSHEDVCLVDNLTKKEYESNFEDMVSLMNDIWNQTQRFEKHNQRLEKEIEQLKSEIEKLSKFENNGEHIRLSINIETGELQRHIYATGQWFGDFDRVLCTNWITEKDYQKFIDRVIEIYNTEFKGDVE